MSAHPRRFVLAMILLVAAVVPAHAGLSLDPFVLLPWNASGTPGEGIGGSVAPAGDVNGDGYGDVLVSTHIDAFVEGGVRLYLGTPQGSSLAPAWFYRGGQPSANAGSVVASAGDVNGDGFFDVLVCVPAWDTLQVEDAGKVAIFHGGPNGLSLTPTYELLSPIPAANQQFGFSAAPAGDVNGDGFGDVVVGAQVADGAFTQRGAAFVYHGGPSGLAASPARTWLGPAGQDSFFGFAVSSAGDVNGDGFSDVLVGAPVANTPFVEAGNTFLYFGSAAGALAVPDTVIKGQAADVLCGFAVSLAGDVNGDGYGDVLVGFPRHSGAFGRQGKAELLFGGPFGPATSVGVSDPDPGPNQNFGIFVATLGDFDGDGFADFGIHANQPDGGFGGRVTIYRGGRPPQVEYVGDLPTTLRASIGASFSSTGDADGDGRAEILVGVWSQFVPKDGGAAYQVKSPRLLPRLAPNAPLSGPQLGSRFGSALAVLPHWSDSTLARLVIGDPQFNGFGRIWIHDGSNQVGVRTAVTALIGGNENFQQLGSRVVDAGDLDGDDVTDFVVTSPTLDVGGVGQAGRVDFYGNTLGMSGVLVTGSHPFDRVGSALAGRGDVNGDGYHDVLIGAREWDEPGKVDAGKAFLFFGGPSGPVVGSPWTVVGSTDRLGLGASVALTDFDGDGYTDVVVGSSAPPSDGFAPGRVAIYYGGPSGPSTNPGLVLQAAQPSLSFGLVVAAIGDVNADGIADLAVGAPNENNVGVVRVYPGTHGRSQNQIPILTLVGSQAGARFGAEIAGGGDLDGDGLGDFAIGQPFYDGGAGQTDEGRVYVHFGAPFVPETPAGFIAESNLLGAEFGAAIAPFRDINGDLFADLIVGAPGQGRVYPYLGGGLATQVDLQASEGSSDLYFHPARAPGPDHLGAQFMMNTAGAGRTRARYQFEAVVQNAPFTGIPTSTSGATSFLSPAPGAPPSIVAAAIPLPQAMPGRAFKVRGRWTTPLPFFPRTRWFTPEAHTSGDHDVWVNGAAVGVPDGPARPAAGLRIDAVWPNPAVGRAGASRVAFTLPRAARTTVDVFDLRGARVRRLLDDEERVAGPSSAAWDGRDDAGRSVGAGVYFVVLRAGVDAEARAKIVRLP